MEIVSLREIAIPGLTQVCVCFGPSCS